MPIEWNWIQRILVWQRSKKNYLIVEATTFLVMNALCCLMPFFCALDTHWNGSLYLNVMTVHWLTAKYDHGHTARCFSLDYIMLRCFYGFATSLNTYKIRMQLCQYSWTLMKPINATTSILHFNLLVMQGDNLKKNHMWQKDSIHYSEYAHEFQLFQQAHDVTIAIVSGHSVNFDIVAVREWSVENHRGTQGVNSFTS